MIKLSSIQSAYSKIRDLFDPTPLEYSERLSKLYHAEIYLKREDLTPVRSYKIRGAYSCMSSLSDAEKKQGIVCASAGNHAQGVAYSAAKLGIYGKIFMPRLTPEQKVYKTRKFGGSYIDVVLVGDTFDDAALEARKYEKESNAMFIHPFDDVRIIAGQGTVGQEIYDQSGDKKPDLILCPVGGGGLISGMISAFRELHPSTHIIGVEPYGAPSMQRSLEIGENTMLERVDTFIDGAAVKRVGDANFGIAKSYQLEVHTVHENAVCTTMLEYLHEEGIVTEPAGALTGAVLRNIRETLVGKKVVIVISGGNFDFERLPEVKERSMKYEGKKRYVLVTFPQRPGALKEFISFFGPDDDITRFEYLKKGSKAMAPALIGIETTDPSNFFHLFEKLNERGMSYQDITENQMFYDLLV